MSDDEVHNAIGLRMGMPLFLQHDCVCIDVMDMFSLHGQVLAHKLGTASLMTQFVGQLSTLKSSP